MILLKSNVTANHLTQAQWIFKSREIMILHPSGIAKKFRPSCTACTRAEISLQCPRGVKSLSHKTWKSIGLESSGQQWHYFLVMSHLNNLKKLVKVKFTNWSAMDFRPGKLGGQQWIFGPGSRFFIQKFKNSWKCKAKDGQQWFFSRLTSRP